MRMLPSMLGLLVCATTATAEPPSREFVAHERPIAALAMSADGKLLVTGGDDRVVTIWDAERGLRQASFRAPDTVTAVALSSDGKRLAIGMWNGSVLLRKAVGTGKELLLRAHEENVTSLVFGSGGIVLATASGDDRCKLWQAERGMPLLTLDPGGDYDITSVALSAGGKWLMLGDGENTVRLFEAATGEEAHALQGHDEAISAVAFLGEKHAASGSWDDTIRIWNLATGKKEKVLRGHTDDVISLSASADGTCLVSAGADATVRVWNTQSGESLRIYRPKSTPRAAAVSANGKRIAIACRERVIIEELP
jgi:WD40 repeat protein